MYAASAYLTKEPILMGSLVVQDWGKMFAAIFIILGTLLQTMNVTVLKDIMAK